MADGKEPPNYFSGERTMAADKVITPLSTSAPATERRHKFYVSGLMVRVLIALAISWLIVMAFFVTTVASR